MAYIQRTGNFLPFLQEPLHAVPLGPVGRAGMRRNIGFEVLIESGPGDALSRAHKNSMQHGIEVFKIVIQEGISR